MFKSLIATALVLIGLSSVAFADEHIDIKGFHLGMTQQEVDTFKNGYYRTDAPTFDRKTFKQLPPLVPCFDDCKPGETPIFTIGGAGIMFDSTQPFVHYTENIADRVLITLSPSKFDVIKDALLTKYSATKCVDSDVSNAMNAHFTQTQCTYQTATEVLTLTRYVDLTTSAITINSVDNLKANAEQAEKAKRDL
jgi:hypothetical protein